MADFEIIPIEAVRGQIYGGMGAGVRGRSPLLYEEIRASFRLGRLGIGMFSKSAKKDGTPMVHQCHMISFDVLYVRKLSSSNEARFESVSPSGVGSGGYFVYTLDAPTSGFARRGEDSLTYLNKDQVLISLGLKNIFFSSSILV